MNFKQLHNQEELLLIANVWDVPSVKIAEKLNLKAIGTSSGAIASLLGYNDGEELQFSELEYIVKRITLNTKLPLSVDLEAGYSRNPIEIADNIKKLVNLGVVGINFEDSIVENEKRKLIDINEFSKTLKEVSSILNDENVNIFINVRTDTFLLEIPNVINETKKRIQSYENAGANGIFTPCIENTSDIKEIVKCTNLPINVMCMPNLPDFETLQSLGVKRVSMGNFLFNKMYNQFENLSQKVITEKSFQPIF